MRTSALAPSSEALLCQLANSSLTPSTIQLVFPPADGLPQALQRQGWTVKIWHRHYGMHQNLLKQGIDSIFASEPPAQDAALTVIFWPKEKPLAAWLVAHINNELTADQQLWLVGGNRSGLKSAAKLLAPFTLTKLASARHCLVYSVMADNAVQDTSLAATAHTITIKDTPVTMVTTPGVFSQQHLDPGTMLLLESLPSLASGAVLDFGCGSGVISAWLANRQPTLQLTAVDVDAFALAATAKTAAHNDLTINHYPVTGAVDIQGRFRHIVTNPPFHTGQQTDLSMAQTLIEHAKRHLTRDGELWLVANAFLPYHDLMANYFSEITVIAQNNRYRVYHARG